MTTSNAQPQIMAAPNSSAQDEPHSLPSELALLTSVLNGCDLHGAILEGLQAMHFYRAPYGWIYAAMLELHTDDKAIDTVTITERLRERGELDHLAIGEATGEGAITALKTREVEGMAVRSYAKTIIEKHTRRLMLRKARELADMAVDEKTDATVQLERHLRGVEKIRPFDLNKEFIAGKDTANHHLNQLRAEAMRKGWHAAPWSAMGVRVPVIKDGDLIVIVGPEGAGKSAMLMNWAQYEAVAGNHTVYIHTEMMSQQVLDRRAVSVNKALSFHQLMKPDEMTDHDWQQVVEASAEIMAWGERMDIWHAGMINEARLLMVMQRMVDDFGTRVFVLDYLNDVELEREKGETDAAAWRRLMARFEDFNNRNHTIIITAAQLNKDGGAYQIGRALKQKAMIYLTLRPETLEHEQPFTHDGVDYRYMPGDYNPRIQVAVEKYRGGGRGVFDLLYVGPRYLWVDVPAGFEDGSDDPGAYDPVFRGSKD